VFLLYLRMVKVANSYGIVISQYISEKEKLTKRLIIITKMKISY
jgi:hypothetical protein